MSTDRTRWPNRYHKDGTVTYWSVYEQRWINHALSVPDAELAAMSEDERGMVAKWLAKPERPVSDPLG